MARIHRSVWSRLWFLTLASTLVVLLAILALTPAAGAQAEVIVSDEGVEVSPNGTVRGFDMGVVVDFGSASIGVSGEPGGELRYTIVVAPPGRSGEFTHPFEFGIDPPPSRTD